MKVSHKSKKEILDTLENVISSCNQAIEGDWDSSMPVGQEGFEAIIDALERVIRYVNNSKD